MLYNNKYLFKKAIWFMRSRFYLFLFKPESIKIKYFNLYACNNKYLFKKPIEGMKNKSKLEARPHNIKSNIYKTKFTNSIFSINCLVFILFLPSFSFFNSKSIAFLFRKNICLDFFQFKIFTTTFKINN